MPAPKSRLTHDTVMYQKHRERVENAKAKTDHQPPVLHAGNFLRLGKLKEDSNTFQNMTKTNVNLLMHINAALRTHGHVQTFTYGQAPMTPRSNLPAKYYNIRKLEKENYALGQRLLCARGKLETRRPISDKDIEKFRERFKYEFPKNILKKYPNLTLPSDPIMRTQLLRPKIDMRLAVKGVRPLGQIIIQLYTEACPEVVLEFVRVCIAHETEKLIFPRLFPTLWLEGELKLSFKSKNLANMEYDMRALDHNTSLGILSFPINSDLNGLRRGMLNFSLSFKPLNVLNGKRVAFGKVCKGRKLLHCIKDYGMKNGKPLKEIVVTKLAVLK